MGYGNLRVDFRVIKDALFLPEDCEIVAAAPLTHGDIQLTIISPSLPNVEGSYIPSLNAISTMEVPPDHECPDGFQCKKITTKLEVSEY